ncbi:RNA polymerase sigma factor [Haliscomenobacter sp.]|uniref:RNA polymerase sigma factor n=1 Tax=Haliscomenobacter sp. TaxID=2717303 RepID=UPI003BA99ED0
MEKEFVQLVQQNAGIIHKVIHLYVDHPEDRRDLYQEVLLQAWKSYAGFKGEAAFSTWLYRISLNTVLTFRRRQRVPISELPSQLDLASEPARQNSEDSELLWLAIKQLNEIDRVIITLHLDGYDNEEIAEVTGLNKNNTTVRLHRAKQSVVQRLKNWSSSKI